MSNWENSRENGTEEDSPYVGNLDDIKHRETNSYDQEAFDKLSKKADWEQKIIHDLAFSSIKEQRSKRRWGIFFKFIIILYIGIVTALVIYPVDGNLESINKAHTALINIEGVIAADSAASADKIVSSLRDAFEDKKTKGVILRMNTPGGSPVQSGYINDEIYRLKKKYPDIPVYAVISDVCASGGYYIAAAADKIYADKASIVGSIGVIMNGFGFVDAMKTLGISRRLYTSGEHKAFLDPFSPQDDVEVKHINSMLKNIHEQFISVVKKGRGDKLSNDPNLFSGYFWTGEKSIEMGLVDKLGSSAYVAREIIGEKKIKEFSHEDDILERFSKKLGASVSTVLLEVFRPSTMDIR
jgi:protease IV